MTEELIVAKKGKAGRLTMNRPEVLNALSWNMALTIERSLLEWRDDDDVALVVIDAAPGRAFGAGGDIKTLWKHGVKGDYAYARGFWWDEYRMNLLINTYPKPIVSLVDGIVMGGGVGVASHCSHRVVSEKTMMAMPECGIGLLPDVGGTWLLAHAPGRLGEFMGLTGTRIGCADALLTRFADYHVPSDRLAELTARLEETGDAGEVEKAAQDPKTAKDPQVAPMLEEMRAGIDAALSADTPMEAAERFAAMDADWAKDAAKAIRRGCPLSVACTFIATRNAREMKSVQEALAEEYRFTYRSQEEGELNEGVRATLVDKDRNPQWASPSLEDVWPERAEYMLSSLGENEWKPETRDWSVGEEKA
ncbi:MAG: enoyl-CoA hydratase/isomerase family protein [Pseudomonadota bacterium]